MDKIWYRSGKNIKIEATWFKILLNEFTDQNGKELSEHYPIPSIIKYELIDGILTSDIFGRKKIKGKGFSFIEKMDDNYPVSVDHLFNW